PTRFRSDAGLVGGARARGDHHGIGPHRQNLVGGGPIVAEDPHLARQFAQILDEVVRERVVVVDDNNHGVPWFARLTRSSARTNAFALFTVSTYSRSGTESATMPAPACTSETMCMTCENRSTLIRSVTRTVP